MRKRKLYIFLLTCLAMVCVFFGCKNITEKIYRSEYTANYGEWFIIPDADSAEIYNAEGKRVQIEANRVFIMETDDYKLVLKQGNSTYTSVIKVNTNIKPQIFVSRDIIYGTVGETVILPEATAYDGVYSLSVRGRILQDSEEIDISDGFVPETAGEYTYSISATSKAGDATYEKHIPVYIEENSDYTDKIASFDKPYGKTHFENSSYDIFYSKEIRLEDEAGATGIQIGNNHFSRELGIYNLHTEDVSDYDAIYFYLYNDSDSPMAFSLNWTEPYSWIPLRNHDWTEIILDTSVFDRFNCFENMSKDFSSRRINGMPIIIECSDPVNAKFYDTVYISSVRGMNRLDKKAVNEEMRKICEIGTLTFRQSTLLDYSYKNLSPEEQNEIVFYEKFFALQRDLKIEQIMSSYGIEKVKDKVVYMDNDKAVEKQIGNVEWMNTILEVTDEKTYLGEKVAKTVLKKNNIESIFTIQEPFIYDLSDYAYISFGIYFDYKESLYLHNSDERYAIGQPCAAIELIPGQWNDVDLSLGDVTDIKNQALWIFHRDQAENWTPVDSDITIYISSFYAKKSVSNELMFEEKWGITQLSLPIGDEFPRDAIIEYTTQKSFDGQKGSVRLSRKPSARANALCVNIANADEKAQSDTVYSMYVYYEGTSDEWLHFFYNNTWNEADGNGTKLIGGEWTKVTFILPKGSALSDYAIFVFDNETWLFHEGDAVYLSSLKREKALTE